MRRSAGRRSREARDRRARASRSRRAGRAASRRTSRRRRIRARPPASALANRGPLALVLGREAARVVVAEQQQVDRRVVADRARRSAREALGLAPRSATCSRAGWRSSRPRAAARRARARSPARAAAARRRARAASSAASPESPPEQVSTARPPRRAAALAARPSPGRARAARAGRAAQAPPASSISARKTRWSPASEPVWAAAARAPASERTDLEHRDPDPALGAVGQSAGELRAVAVGLEEQGDRADAVRSRERRQPVARVEHRLVAGRDHGVEADAAARAERVDGDVAALGDHRHAAGLERAGTESPHSGARAATATTPLPFGPQTGSPASSAACAKLGLELAAGIDLAEARRRSTIAPPQPRAAISPDQRRRRRPRGSRPRPRRRAPAASATVGTQGRPWTSVALRVDAPDSPAKPARSRLRRTVSP